MSSDADKRMKAEVHYPYTRMFLAETLAYFLLYW